MAIDPSRYRRPELPQGRSDLFAGSIRLVGADLPPDPVRAGTTLPVRLAWHAEQPPSGQYTAFVHLVDEAGQLRAQSDQVPVRGTRPTADWIAGEYVLDEHQLALPPELAPGAYRLIAGLYDSATGRRAPVTAGVAGSGLPDVVKLSRVRIIGG